MRLIDLTFERWLKNHPPDHNDKWYRELYPFNIFSFIDFDEAKIGIEQRIDFNRISYYITITKIELQETGRYRTTFGLTTFSKSKALQWKNRKWDTIFQIVYSQELKFITVFTKKEDPSKDYVTRFMTGNFERINEHRSLQVSNLLIRTLALQMAEEAFPKGKYHEIFKFIPKGIRNLTNPSQFIQKELDFSPIYSLDRELWICYSFTEEKAHRLAYYLANQCEKLIIIYCNPTYAKHHRCKHEGTHVVSLYEFGNAVSAEVRKKYEPQIRFIQNHLNRPDNINSKDLLCEINNPIQEVYEIKKSELMESLSVIRILPKNEEDFFYSLCAFNLINAFLSRQRATEKGEKSKLYKEMYYFKTYLANILIDKVNKNECQLYISEQLIIIEIFGFQFSFHNIPLDETLIRYRESSTNKEIVWSGRKLQPIAPLLLNYSRAIRQNK